MMLFSERVGLKPVKNAIQIDSVDDDLRNGLWNVFYNLFFEQNDEIYIYNSSLRTLMKNIQINYFKKPIDETDTRPLYFVSEIKDYFFNTVKWYEVYDLIEFIAQNHPDEYLSGQFEGYCNNVLEKEVSAYRFVSGRITQLTQPEEIQEIEDAITNPCTNQLVKKHINQALSFLSDRQQPDYRNSIKESISAVETVTKAIVGDQNTTLGKALNKIEENGTIQLHKDLKEGFKKIYHYTSDSGGIRHALKDNNNVEFEDAKFMLVSCSAFCNYLIDKARKSDISIN
ncbi:AbiJ-NTD4 domain-containing protein [Paraliobacillus salinarum]|uniref:AbiJ-NTD4 domain-containing protein n=1 Tax=Paraliobacillus salinarum TaxID=1158996 RepID=UPI0015F508EA|nr:hypothetical protein [Paraliobacillus salinarum]